MLLLLLQMAVTVLSAFILLTAPSGISAASPCTTSLPAVAIEGGECPALGGETGNETVIERNVSNLLEEVTRCMQQLGRTPEYPVNSCTELAE